MDGPLTELVLSTIWNKTFHCPVPNCPMLKCLNCAKHDLGTLDLCKKQGGISNLQTLQMLNSVKLSFFETPSIWRVGGESVHPKYVKPWPGKIKPSKNSDDDICTSRRPRKVNSQVVGLQLWPQVLCLCFANSPDYLVMFVVNIWTVWPSWPWVGSFQNKDITCCQQFLA